MKQAKTCTLSKVIVQGDVGRKIRTRVECARSKSAIFAGNEGMLVHPICARERTLEAGGNTITGGVNAILGIKVDFRDDTSHIDTLVVWQWIGQQPRFY